jgi:cytochrome c oxidase assembly protein subunit 15
MTQKYSPLFIKLNWLALVLIFAVIIAGSVVRTTGSGMGCPDWPKCFGSWVPPRCKGAASGLQKDIWRITRQKGGKILQVPDFDRHV